MHTLTALYDAPTPAATALRALAAAGHAPADIDVVAARPLPGAAHGGDLAAEIALRTERFVDAGAATALAAALAEALPERGVPSEHAAEMAATVAAGRGWLVGVACPDALVARARRALLAAGPVAVYIA